MASERYTSGERRGSRPSTVTVPVEGVSSPTTMRRRVVFPAPLGPSRPVTPGPNEQVRSDTATFCPNHFDTWRISMVGSATQEGEGAVTPTSDSGASRAPR